jgi:2'-5' RNA ligase
VRWARPEQLHLTLRFLGNVPRNELTRLGEALSSACAELRAFELGLAELGCFPHSRSPRVVWIGVTGAVTQLDGLERRVEEALRGFGDPAEEARAFHPHLTIGRVKARGDEGRRLGDLLARERVPELGAWPVRQVDLVQSELSPQSARHTVLHSVRLND